MKYDFAYPLIGRIVVKFPKDILSRFICAVFGLRRERRGREGGSATETEYSEIPTDPDKRQESLSVASETFSSSHCVAAFPLALLALSPFPSLSPSLHAVRCSTPSADCIYIFPSDLPLSPSLPSKAKQGLLSCYALCCAAGPLPRRPRPRGHGRSRRTSRLTLSFSAGLNEALLFSPLHSSIHPSLALVLYSLGCQRLLKKFRYFGYFQLNNEFRMDICQMIQ